MDKVGHGSISNQYLQLELPLIKSSKRVCPQINLDGTIKRETAL